jgi:hypothetical protein
MVIDRFVGHRLLFIIQEINMESEINTESIAADTPHGLSARDRGAPGKFRSLRPHIVGGEAKLPLGDEAPDPRYWTAYDIHMIERDARAMRRAQVYSMLAALWGRLRRRTFVVGGSAQTERSVA